MKLRHAILLCGLLLAASCTSGTEGIFASIEREEKIISLGGLNANATVSSMTEFGTKYYATGGRALFSRDIGATAWDKAAVDGSGDVLSVGAVNKTVLKLFAVTAKDGGTLYSSPDGAVWTKIPLGTDLALRLVPIRTGDGETNEGLLVVAAANVYFIDASSNLSAAVALGSQTPVHSAVYDGTDYYLASKSVIWKVDSSHTTVSVALTSAQPQGFDFAGLIYINTALATGATVGGFFVSTPSHDTTGGGIYRDATGPLDALTPLATNVKVSDDLADFGSWLYNSDNKKLMVGTLTSIETGKTGNGYMEVSLETGTFSTTPDTDSHNYQSSVLPSASILTFFRSSGGKTFAGTWANGLWVWDATQEIWSQQ